MTRSFAAVMRSPHTKKKLWGYFFILPNLIILGIFLIFPLLKTFYLSFFEAGIYDQTFVGLKNYIDMAGDTLFLKSLLNTVFYVLLIVPATIILSLLVAVLAQGLGKRARNAFRLIFYLPVICSTVVLSLIWGWMLNPSFGIVNYFITLFGGTRTDVFAQPGTAIIALSAVILTWMVGQPIILYMSAMDGVPKELYESAEIDSANPFQEFFQITLPLIGNTTVLNLITTTINVFQIFTVIYLMTRGGPFHGTESLVFTIYQTAFVSLEYGKASAQGVVLFIIILIISLVQLWVTRPKDD